MREQVPGRVREQEQVREQVRELELGQVQERERGLELGRVQGHHQGCPAREDTPAWFPGRGGWAGELGHGG